MDKKQQWLRAATELFVRRNDLRDLVARDATRVRGWLKQTAQNANIVLYWTLFKAHVGPVTGCRESVGCAGLEG